MNAPETPTPPEAAFHLLPGRAAAVRHAASRHSGRFALDCVRLAVGGPRFVVEASDGHIAARISGPLGADAPFPPFPSAHVAPSESGGLIRSSHLHAALPAEGPCHGLAARLSAGQVELAAASRSRLVTLTSGPAGEGRFPDLDAVTPPGPALASLLLDPRLLIRLLTVAIDMTDDYWPAEVTLELHERMLVLKSRSGPLDLLGLQMPLLCPVPVPAPAQPLTAPEEAPCPASR